MGMFGRLFGGSSGGANGMVVDDGMGAPSSNPFGGINTGKIANTAGQIGDILTGNPVFANRQNASYKQQLELAQTQAALHKAQLDADPASIRALRAAGIDPASPQGQRIISDNLSAPRYMMMGTPETGQTIVNPSQMGAPSPVGGIPQAAIDRLKANPGEASMFDEHFGPGSSASVLGQR